ncbi:MAG TPA: hypothetical protein VFX14_00460 [Methylomirabilota bacterium]|nr:hypothetical protein [Methylomirabilota bacterium]
MRSSRPGRPPPKWGGGRSLGAMPPWRHLPESERWAVIHHPRSLKK